MIGDHNLLLKFRKEHFSCATDFNLITTNDLMNHNSSLLCFMEVSFLFLKFTTRKDLRLDSLLTFFLLIFLAHKTLSKWCRMERKTFSSLSIHSAKLQQLLICRNNSLGIHNKFLLTFYTRLEFWLRSTKKIKKRFTCE